MLIKFWGTRGSIPTPGVSTVRYGGNTSCVELRSASGTLVILDCGTGLRALGKSLLANDPHPLHGHILITHTHWDHIQGLPFFAPLFVQGNEWDVYAPRGFEHSLRETLAGQMQYTYFPVTLEQLGSNIRYHELVEGELRLGDIKVKTQYLNHTVVTLGYRLEVDGVVVVYATDHEPYTRHLGAIHGLIGKQDQLHIDFLAGADLVIHDAQYTSKEYDEKLGWGHSTVEYTVEVCRRAKVKKIAFMHHDPLRTDEALDLIVETTQKKLRESGSTMEVFGAAEGQSLNLESAVGPPMATEEPSISESALAPSQSAIVDQSVLLGIADPNTGHDLEEAIQASGIETKLKKEEDAILNAVERDRPSLVILEQNPPVMYGTQLSDKIRKGEYALASNLPIIMVTDKEEDAAKGIEGISGWLIKPFSSLYARTHVHAWLLRTICRWEKASIPPDEDKRLAVLRSLNILDTEPEERFDRLTRLAAALFDMPIAFITLVDQNRQWFKSCIGVSAKETSRESSFCAHVVVQRSMMLIPDTLLDDRFADNPLVTGEPHIRFYCGQPLILNDGTCIGTICLVDTRPRQLSDNAKDLLKDLGNLVIRELSLQTEAKV